ncbi:hypothetical protein P171DRAFT_512093 [Karstenula rhodostoma CBS 690.94]|uniref:Uncharacterized protein n=1 Tax=Karstenula rhodostoma CBS 690.94 TaxID=1392251 RepID=A0A9P4PNA5_9PLEO|nr:hypothetical protein P171DRAFT_512093 [Karstenula rhodostoma CBS 690.94]
MSAMKVKIHTILLACSAFAFRYAAAGTIPPDMDLEVTPDPMIDQSILGSLAANGAKTHAASCRWTNCKENCPPGFVEVPRDQGEKGEIISEHTVCAGSNSRTKFCCPPSPDMTKCYWRGFSNSGRCTPGCEIRKNNRGAEVGTSKAGCTKSGYQSVCCTTPQSEEAMAGVLAYYQCGWYSAAKFPKNEKRELCAEPGKSFACPANRPSFIASSNLGFGGEVACLEGLRSYCCSKDVLPVFKNCAWQRSCPNDQIRVAVRSDGGKDAAFCCAGETLQQRKKPPPEPKPEPKPDPEPLSTRIALFRGYVDYWMDRRLGEHACPLILRPPILDWDKHPLGIVPQSSLDATTEPEAVSPLEATADYTPGGMCVKAWAAISDFLHVVTKAARDTYVGDELKLMYEILDQKLKKQPDCQGCKLSDFIGFADDHPYLNTTSMIYSFLEEPGMSLGEVQCTPEPGHHAAASVIEDTWLNSDAAALQRRIIDPDLDPKDRAEWPVNNPSPTPAILPQTGLPLVTFGRVMEAIQHGRLTLHYAMWHYYEDRVNNRLRPGPSLELAYWIGQTPGQIPSPAEESNLRLAELRDPRNTLNNPHILDRWVILHLHLDESNWMLSSMFSEHQVAAPNDPMQTTTRTFTNIASISIYHAQAWLPNYDVAGNAFMWTVAGQDTGRNGRNGRRVLNCRNGLAYSLGQQYPTIPVGPGPIVSERRLVDPGWAPGSAPAWVFTNLYNQGYLGFSGIEPILNRPRGIARIDHYTPPEYDLNITSVNDGFRPRSHGHDGPEDATRMIGWQNDEDVGRATPWNSPFIIRRSGNGRMVRRPVTELPTFPSGTQNPLIAPPPPAPAPNGPAPPPPPPGRGPWNMQPHYLLPISKPGGYVDEGDTVQELNSTSNLTSIASASALAS